MARQEIRTDKCPKPAGHFAQAIAADAGGRLVFISGMVAQRADGTIAGIDAGRGEQVHPSRLPDRDERDRRGMTLRRVP